MPSTCLRPSTSTPDGEVDGLVDAPCRRRGPSPRWRRGTRSGRPHRAAGPATRAARRGSPSVTVEIRLRGHLHAVDASRTGPHVPRRQASGVRGADPLVEPRQAAGVLRDELGSNVPLRSRGRPDRPRRRRSAPSWRRAVAGVARPAPGRIAALVAEMIGQLARPSARSSTAWSARPAPRRDRAARRRRRRPGPSTRPAPPRPATASTRSARPAARRPAAGSKSLSSST